MIVMLKKMELEIMMTLRFKVDDSDVEEDEVGDNDEK